MQSLNPDPAFTYGDALRQHRQKEEMERRSKIPFSAPSDNQWNGPSLRSVAVGYSPNSSLYHPEAMRAFHQVTKATAAEAGLATQQPLTKLCCQIDVLMHSLKTVYDPATIKELDALLAEHPEPGIVGRPCMRGRATRKSREPTPGSPMR
jgi:hypothetical protein